MKKGLTLLSFFSLITLFVVYKTGGFSNSQAEADIADQDSTQTLQTTLDSAYLHNEEFILMSTSKSMVTIDQSGIADSLKVKFNFDSLLRIKLPDSTASKK